jgi:hypothetical protein
MKSNTLLGRAVLVAACLLLVAGGTAFAQLQTGNLYGKIVDQQGTPLPGVTVTLDTGAAQEVQVSNAQGEVRFLSLPPASMKMKAELQGFATVEYPNVVITVGHNTTLDVTMQSAIEDIITVTAESPLLDERKISTGATINATELQKIPTSRDPWTILSSAPGVQVDRINIGGNESGQQALYVGPGSGTGQAIWSVDGVVITDMSALGSSPSYYDFDAFQEMQVTTGGTDTTLATGGVVLNMVTKRGTNEWRGSGRYIYTPSSAQSSTSFSNSDLGTGQPSFSSANRIASVLDYGAEIGGPIVKDRLWIWGSYGDQKVNTVALNGTTNKADLPTYNAKVNAQVTPSNSLTLFGVNNAKTVLGRNAGPFRPQETTWNQGHNGPKPTALKAEDTQIFGPNFYLTGLYSRVEGGFGLFPEGGIGPVVYRSADHVWHNSFEDFQTLRPQQQGKLDASTFFNFANVSNELKYGASYRRVETDSMTTFGPYGYIFNSALVGTPAGSNLFVADRGSNFRIRNTYTSGYLQDTLTSGNLTANIGVRYDRQGGAELSSTEAANSAAPNILPAFNYAGGSDGFKPWSNITPRVGATYALGKERKTLLRASYSRFADQMGAAVAGFINPAATQTYFYFYTPSIGPGAPTNLVPLNYSGTVNPATKLPYVFNGIDRNLSAPLTDEILGSVEHAVLPELVVGLNLTYRHLHNLAQNDLLVFDDPSNNPFGPSFNSVGRPATSADYVANTATGTLRDGRPFTVTYYTLKPGLVTRGGLFQRNGGLTQDYKGASLVVNKRLSNNWMMRGNITYSDWTWGGTGSLPDQTELVPGGARNGDAVLSASGAGSGPKSFVYINSKWSANLNGLYQIAADRPWGFNVAGNLTARQGYAIPYYVVENLNGVTPGVNNYAGSVTQANVLINRPDSSRLPSLVDFDARLEKEFSFQDFGLTLGVDCFNLFNSSTVLQRVANAGLNGSAHNENWVFEILSPRIFRFGARINFR